MSTHREHSRANWNANSSTLEEINTGSLQRIADATEKMAASYDAMRDERDRYRRYWLEEQERTQRLYLSTRSLRGVITKLKRSRT